MRYYDGGSPFHGRLQDSKGIDRFVSRVTSVMLGDVYNYQLSMRLGVTGIHQIGILISALSLCVLLARSCNIFVPITSSSNTTFLLLG